MNFRKSILAFALAATMLLPLAAQQNTNPGGRRKSELSYYSAPIYKIMDSSSAYVVIYGKAHNKMGTVTVPKEWARNRPGEIRKLVVRNLPTKLAPYITIVKRSGEFCKVIITAPTNHREQVWGIANETKVEDVDGIESVDLEI